MANEKGIIGTVQPTGSPSDFLAGDLVFRNPGAGVIPPKTLFFVSSAGVNQAWTNQPAAQTELFGSVFGRIRADLSGYGRFRILATQAVAGNSGALLRALYSTNDGSTWANLQDSGTTGDVSAGTGTGLKSGAWVPISAFARTDVTLRLDGIGGNATADPAWRMISLEVKA